VDDCGWCRCLIELFEFKTVIRNPISPFTKRQPGNFVLKRDPPDTRPLPAGDKKLPASVATVTMAYDVTVELPNTFPRSNLPDPNLPQS